MASCAICRTELGGLETYECAYCGGGHCKDHRLPEAHDCPGLTNTSSNSEWYHAKFAKSNMRSDLRRRPRKTSRSLTPIDPENIDTYGGPTSSTAWKEEARERDPSPDVAPDGSIIRIDDETIREVENELRRERWAKRVAICVGIALVLAVVLGMIYLW